LLDQVEKLVDDAIEACAGSPEAGHLQESRRRLREPLRVAIAGKVKAGKSTLLNALIGEELAPTDAGECTRIIAWYREGITYRVYLQPRDGDARQVPFRRDAGAIDVDLQGVDPAGIDRIVIEWPAPTLRAMTLIDTPGLGSLTVQASESTRLFLTGDAEQPGQADAVLYLMRHLHGEDAEFLEAFRGETARPNPINAIAVISRADEVAGGRLDAMASAERIARRYREDAKVRTICQTVVPVAGLLAETGATLTEEEFRALDRLAHAPRADTDRLLLTADRFLNSEATVVLTPIERAHLTTRLGLFGVRLAVSLLRDQVVTTARQLAEALVARSGVAELRDLLFSQFAARSDVLRARSALLAVDAALRRAAGPQQERLLAEVERIESSAHDFAEIRLLQAIRDGAVPMDRLELAGAEQLLGAAGTALADRVGQPATAGVDALRAAALAALTRWQQRAENPLSSREVVEASRVLVRTCEGIVTDLDALVRPSVDGPPAARAH
jgi:hypothetical protein